MSNLELIELGRNLERQEQSLRQTENNLKGILQSVDKVKATVRELQVLTREAKKNAAPALLTEAST